MSPLKALLIVLPLLGVVASLDSYQNPFVQPYDWDYLSNLYDDAGLYGRPGRGEQLSTAFGDKDLGCGKNIHKDVGKGKGCGNLQINISNPEERGYSIAQKAAEDAKAASDGQMGAAEAASHQVKVDLAEKAMQSAKAAEAALAGKQEMLEQLVTEQVDAEAILTALIQKLPFIQETADCMEAGLRREQVQLSHLTKIVESANNNLANIKSLGKGAHLEKSEKLEVLKAAQNRLDNLKAQYAEASKDFEATKVAAYKAACAAVEAKEKAQRPRRMSWMFGPLLH